MGWLLPRPSHRFDTSVTAMAARTAISWNGNLIMYRLAPQGKVLGVTFHRLPDWVREPRSSIGLRALVFQGLL